MNTAAKLMREILDRYKTKSLGTGIMTDNDLFNLINIPSGRYPVETLKEALNAMTNEGLLTAPDSHGVRRITAKRHAKLATFGK